jgi:SpoVK/Ycf46/Vps4 family AAA+-type ATPase
VRQRTKVYEEWGFRRRAPRARITALFAGVSGTGKTMASEVLANDLQLDLYRIDLSQVVSKYIGETEKNLRRVFDAAEGGGVILLFDEADALFGRRSEVRTATIATPTSRSVTCSSGWRSIAASPSSRPISAGHLDHAFLRRLRFIVEFRFRTRGRGRISGVACFRQRHRWRAWIPTSWPG